MSTSCSASRFFSDDRKQDDDTTIEQRKSLIALLKEKVLTSSLIKLWEHTDGFTDQYRYASALYLLSHAGTECKVIYILY